MPGMAMVGLWLNILLLVGSVTPTTAFVGGGPRIPSKTSGNRLSAIPRNPTTVTGLDLYTPLLVPTPQTGLEREEGSIWDNFQEIFIIEEGNQTQRLLMQAVPYFYFRHELGIPEEKMYRIAISYGNVSLNEPTSKKAFKAKPFTDCHLLVVCGPIPGVRDEPIHVEAEIRIPQEGAGVDPT